MTAAFRKTRLLTQTALLFALAVVLSLVEGLLPALPVPGVRLGLSNIPVMYALFFLGKGPAASIAGLKGAFAALTRGAAAGLLSVSGGLCSVGAMALLLWLSKKRASCFLLSICGAVCHNLGQLAAVSLLYETFGFQFYLPVLLAAGIAAGAVTAVLLRVLQPAFARLEGGKRS